MVSLVQLLDSSNWINPKHIRCIWRSHFFAPAHYTLTLYIPDKLCICLRRDRFLLFLLLFRSSSAPYTYVTTTYCIENVVYVCFLYNLQRETKLMISFGDGTEKLFFILGRIARRKWNRFVSHYNEILYECHMCRICICVAVNCIMHSKHFN